MNKRYDHSYSSCIAVPIEGLISERRASGFMYNSAANVLKQLDTFCINNGSQKNWLMPGASSVIRRESIPEIFECPF